MATENANIESTQKAPLARTFVRNTGLPIDSTSIYSSVELAEEYAKTTTGYVGQYIAVKNSDGTYTGYMIKDATGTLAPTTYKGSTNVSIAEDGTISTTGVLSAAAQKLATTESSDNKSYLVPLVAKNDINEGTDVVTTSKLTVNPLTGELKASKIKGESFTATSDARLKENFRSLISEKSILDLSTYKFDFINGSKNQIGCKAQDLQEICPEIIDEDDDGYLSIQESKIVYLLLEEVKKLRKEVDILKR